MLSSETQQSEMSAKTQRTSTATPAPPDDVASPRSKEAALENLRMAGYSVVIIIQKQSSIKPWNGGEEHGGIGRKSVK